MTLHQMLSELIELGETQRTIANNMAGTPFAPTQSTLSKVLRDVREPRYSAGKAIEEYYKANIARLRRKHKKSIAQPK